MSRFAFWDPDAPLPGHFNDRNRPFRNFAEILTASTGSDTIIIKPQLSRPAALIIEGQLGLNNYTFEGTVGADYIIGIAFTGNLGNVFVFEKAHLIFPFNYRSEVSIETYQSAVELDPAGLDSLEVFGGNFYFEDSSITINFNGLRHYIIDLRGDQWYMDANSRLYINLQTSKLERLSVFRATSVVFNLVGSSVRFGFLGADYPITFIEDITNDASLNGDNCPKDIADSNRRNILGQVPNLFENGVINFEITEFFKTPLTLIKGLNLSTIFKSWTIDSRPVVLYRVKENAILSFTDMVVSSIILPRDHKCNKPCNKCCKKSHNFRKISWSVTEASGCSFSSC